MKSLDMNFINSTLKVTSFNLSTKDFTSLTHKTEIQYLFNIHFFPNFDISKTINVVDKDKLNTLINTLKSESIENFKKLHGYNLKGIGPGEVTMYFLINNSRLGGGSSSAKDIIVGNEGYEVKAVKITNDGMAIDFKIGGTISLTEVMNDLNQLRTTLGLGGSKSEIASTVIKSMQEKAPKQYGEILKKFAKISYDGYFKDQDVIFINNSPSSRIGNVEAIKRVGLNDILIERVTSGTIKPKIKL